MKHFFYSIAIVFLFTAAQETVPMQRKNKELSPRHHITSIDLKTKLLLFSVLAGIAIQEGEAMNNKKNNHKILESKTYNNSLRDLKMIALHTNVSNTCHPIPSRNCKTIKNIHFMYH